MIHLFLTGQYTNGKIAKLLDVHPNTIGKWMKREDVRAVIAQMQQDEMAIVSAGLKALTMPAISKMRELIQSPIDGVALQAVKDILDRAGHKPKQEIKIDKTVRTYEQRLSELIDATIVEAEVVEDGD